MRKSKNTSTWRVIGWEVQSQVFKGPLVHLWHRIHWTVPVQHLEPVHCQGKRMPIGQPASEMFSSAALLAFDLSSPTCLGWWDGFLLTTHRKSWNFLLLLFQWGNYPEWSMTLLQNLDISRSRAPSKFWNVCFSTISCVFTSYSIVYFKKTIIQSCCILS